MMTCAPCVQPNPLPLTTGRVGLSQTTGELQFYGHNYRGTGMGLFVGQWKWPCPPPCPPQWGPPSFACKPWASGCSCGGCGCNQCCNPCLAGANCFAQLLTNIGPWCGYWRDQQWTAWMTGKQPWPATNTAAQTEMAASLPAPCLPPAATPAAA